MKVEDTIQATLNKVWPDEVVIVGASTTRDIAKGVANGDTHFVQARGGADFDVSATVSLLIQAATLIKVCIEIWKSLHPEKKSDSEIEKAIKADSRVKHLSAELLEKVASILAALSG